MSKAMHQVIVHHPGGLHVRITNGRADEIESALLQVLAHRVRDARSGRDVFHRARVVDDRAALHETPDVTVEAAEFFLHS